MRTAFGILTVIVVGVVANTIGQRMDSNALIMTVGVLFGMLASLPAALLVAAQRPAEPTENHHTHDVTIRIIPPGVLSAMAQYGADDAVRINGQWLLLDGDRVVSSQRLLAG